jgi:hypothetical protein
MEAKNPTMPMKLLRSEWCDLWDELSGQQGWEQVQDVIQRRLNNTDPRIDLVEMQPYRQTMENMLKLVKNEQLRLRIDRQIQASIAFEWR